MGSISLHRESEFSHYCWELLRKHVGLSWADILPGHWLGGWKVVSCHSSAQSSSHEWACIAALERAWREASPVWLYFYLRHWSEHRRCRWTYMRWVMHTIHSLCRLCIERNLPQVCPSAFYFFGCGCSVIESVIRVMACSVWDSPHEIYCVKCIFLRLECSGVAECLNIFLSKALNPRLLQIGTVSGFG